MQGGLVGWLDGIRNVGIDQPHDGEATTWADLSGRASDVTLRTNDRTHWTSDGYYFNIGSDGTSSSYAYLKPQLSLGENGTIEIACDVKYYEQNPNGVSGDFVSRLVAYTTGSGSSEGSPYAASSDAASCTVCTRSSGRMFSAESSSGFSSVTI